MVSVLSLFVLLSATGGAVFAVTQPEYECASELLHSDIPVGAFYLTLSPAAVVPENTTESEATCPTDDLRVKDLSCMCGHKLIKQQEAIQTRLNTSCEFYEEQISNHPSPLGFCERAIEQMGECVTFEPAPVGSTGAFTNITLATKLREVNGILLGYFGVLDRTLVHVYLPSKEHRCQCLEYYKRWLCASRLVFFVSSDNNSNLTTAPPSTDSTLNNISNDSDSSYIEIRPCLGVCYDVLQTCPYYLPSKYQPRNDSDEPYEVTYGGYPAFDCPRRAYCEMQGKNCKYGDETFCFGRNHAVGLTSSFVLCVYIAVVIVCVTQYIFL